MPDRKIVVMQPAADGPRFAVLPPEDHAEIHGLLAAYGRFFDDGAIDDFMGLIADDAIFYPNWPGVAPDVVEGAAALREFFVGAYGHPIAKGAKPYHQATNVIIVRATATTAEASVTMQYAEFTPGKAPELLMVGQYDFQLEKRDGRWFIACWSMRYEK
jgi:hypothetical protein